jgi:phosphatidylglycerophosphatase A
MPDEAGPGAGRPVALLLLSAFGLGSSRIMPGTVASLAVAASMLLVTGRPLPALALAGLFVLYGVFVTLRFAGVVAGPRGRGDPGWVVSDEVAGQALACLGAIPHGGGWAPVAGAFVLFRLLDILKPWPVGALERLHGARGILLDDVAAGVLAALAVLAAGMLGAFDAL